MPPAEPEVRNPREEAQVLAGAGWDARVLEPSPPAIVDEWFADDPVAADGSDRPALMPAGTRVPDWSTWLADHPDQEGWVRDRWLGGRRRLRPVPATLVSTRVALHRLAAYVIAPTRHDATTKFGLRFTQGGFGTPFFGPNRQIRVLGDRLVDQRGGEVRTAAITTLAAAADFLETTIRTDAGAEHDSPPLGDIHEELAIDAEASAFLGDWFGMAFAALESVRAEPASVDPSRPQLWPGHFDPAIEVGDEDRRASYGASPGDASSAEPYLYVSVWWPDRVGIQQGDSGWNASSFTGAVLPLSELGDVTGPTATDDPVEAAARFWLEARDRLG